MTRRTAVLALVLAVILWSTSGLLIKLVTVNALALTGGRSAVAAFVTLAFLRRPHFTWSSAQVGGAVAYVFTQVLFVYATQQTTAANAIFLQYTAPLWVALFSIWFLKERPIAADWWAMGAILAGMGLFFAEDLTSAGMMGNVSAILSGVSLAWLVLFMRKQKDGSPLETILLGNVLAALVGLPFLWGESLTPADVGGLLFLGVFQIGLSMVLFSAAIKHLTAIESILIQTLEPVLNPIWVFLIIAESPTVPALLGGGVVILTVTARSIITARSKRRLRRPKIDQK